MALQHFSSNLLLGSAGSKRKLQDALKLHWWNFRQVFLLNSCKSQIVATLKLTFTALFSNHSSPEAIIKSRVQTIDMQSDQDKNTPQSVNSFLHVISCPYHATLYLSNVLMSISCYIVLVKCSHVHITLHCTCQMFSCTDHVSDISRMQSSSLLNALECKKSMFFKMLKPTCYL